MLRPFLRYFSTKAKKSNHLKIRLKRKLDNARMKASEPNRTSPLPTVSLVGLPNVGKSTLFNRLVKGEGRRRKGARAIVAATPQTTRDFRESTARIGDMYFNLVDTGGLETGGGRGTNISTTTPLHGGGRHEAQSKYGTHAGLEQHMLQLTTSVVRRSDVVFLMLDGKNGISSLDEHFARWLRKIESEGSLGKKRIVYPVINKMEGTTEDSLEFQTLLSDAHRLGFGEPMYISAEQGHGFADLFSAISDATETEEIEEIETETKEKKNASKTKISTRSTTSTASTTSITSTTPITSITSTTSTTGTIETIEDEASTVLQLAIIGRPNVGKSTLLNQICGEERVLTGPTPGLTRDPIRIEIPVTKDSNSQPGEPEFLRVIDTAGIRRPGKRDTTSTIESESVAESIHALEFSHVVAVMIDASNVPTKMDMALVGRVLDEGRALVVIANKTDTMNGYGEHKAIQPEDLGEAVIDHLAGSIPTVKGVPVVAMSALKGKGVQKLIPAVMEAYRRWDRRVTTGTLNQWIEAVQRHTPPPRGANIKFGSQVSNRPPKFLFFSNGTQEVPEHYLRFLSKSLRNEFDMGGVPIRVKVVAKEKRGGGGKRSQRVRKGSAR